MGFHSLHQSTARTFANDQFVIGGRARHSPTASLRIEAVVGL
jgi:hypothetical protein